MLRRHSRVYPIRLRRQREDGGDAAFLHNQYFQYRNRMLALFAQGFPEDKVSRRFKRWLSSPILRTISWFAIDVLYCAIKVNKNNWRHAKDETGKGRLRQLLECLWCALSTPSMPENYYKFEWFNEISRTRRHEYLHRYEMKAVLYPLMYTPEEIKQAPFLVDKSAWQHWATANNIPSPGLLGELDGGRYRPHAADSPEQIAQDCFVKPALEKGGKDSALFIYDPEAGQFKNIATGERGPLKTLLRKQLLDSEEKRKRYLIQPRLRVHRSLQRLSGQAAATARIITVINESGAPEVVSAHFRIPRNQNDHVDNMHAGGLACAVKIHNGELGPATDYGLSGQNDFYYSHPFNEENIAGTLLPDWQLACDIALQAHRNAVPIKLVGWDVCLGDNGPVIVEANLQPCTDGPQRRQREPLGQARLAQLIAYHIRMSGLEADWNNYQPGPELALLANEN